MRRREMMHGCNRQYLAYLESTGEQWIDTGYIPVANTVFEFCAAFRNMVDGGYATYGAIERIQGGNYKRMHAGLAISKNNTLRISADPSDNNYVSISNDGLYHNFSVSASLCAIDGASKPATLIVPGISLYLFNRNNDGTTNTNMPYGQVVTESRCAYCKIYEGDKLIRDYRPCLDCNGAPCMYEEMQGKYYYNSGTGKFLYGLSEEGYVQ